MDMPPLFAQPPSSSLGPSSQGDEMSRARNLVSMITCCGQFLVFTPRTVSNEWHRSLRRRGPTVCAAAAHCTRAATPSAHTPFPFVQTG